MIDALIIVFGLLSIVLLVAIFLSLLIGRDE